MKTLISTLSLLCVFMLNQSAFAQSKRAAASAGRAEYVEVEPNVKLHVTDLGEGQPIVLIHGWPLNDAMYEYQYQYFVANIAIHQSQFWSCLILAREK